jgi:hypothetical protein
MAMALSFGLIAMIAGELTVMTNETPLRTIFVRAL